MKTEQLKKPRVFRMLCDGEEEWRGRAYDANHAEERAFYNEEPASLCRYTLQVWTGAAWRDVYRNESIRL